MRPARISKNTGVIWLRKAAKRGEGSRGGRIIGHTRSGKAIYAVRKGGQTMLRIDGGGRYSGENLLVPGPKSPRYIAQGGGPSPKGAAATRAMPSASPAEHGLAMEAHAAYANDQLRLGRHASSVAASHASSDHGEAMLLGMHGSRRGQPVRGSQAEREAAVAGRTMNGKAILHPLPGDYEKTEDEGMFVSDRDNNRISQATINHFPHYSHGDHRSAARHHEMKVRSMESDPSHDLGVLLRHQDGRLAHSLAANRLEDEARTNKSAGHTPNSLEALRKAAKRGEGSHGGRVIGHTKSGKPIYENRGADHPSYHGFSSADHIDALELHGNLSDYHDEAAHAANRRKDRHAGLHALTFKGVARDHREKSVEHTNSADSHFEAAHPRLKKPHPIFGET